MRIRSVVVVLCAVLGAGLLPATAAAQPVAPSSSAGAAGIGDPYFPDDGNGGYDVENYALDLTYLPDEDRLFGTATIRAQATQALSSFNLDLDHANLKVTAVTIDGRAATWETSGAQELVVTPARQIRNRARYSTVVTYEGVPKTILDEEFGDSGFFHTNDGAVVIGQPDVATSWFPANDHPRDAASFDFRITVPEGLEAVANGRLRGTQTRAGKSTWTWQAREPMAPYLAGLAIGQFDLRAYQNRGIRYWDAIDPALDSTLPPVRDDEGAIPPEQTYGQVARTALARQPEVVAFLEQTIRRRYPFSEAGGVVDLEPRLFFALENQTRPIYSQHFFDSTFSDAEPFAASVVVHELAHQWFGDDLRLFAWKDIWLNEGFATYMEWLWADREGLTPVQEQFDALADVPADNPFWATTIGDPGSSNEELFDISVYFRGAMTLHALRVEIGDDAFFRLLQRWAGRYAGQTVRTEQFITLAEQVSGRQLDDFFKRWLFTPERPSDLSTPAAESAAAAAVSADGTPAPAAEGTPTPSAESTPARPAEDDMASDATARRTVDIDDGRAVQVDGRRHTLRPSIGG